MLRDNFEGGRSAWMDLDDFSNIEKKYLSCDIETRIGQGQETFVEATQIYTKDEF